MKGKIVPILLAFVGLIMVISLGSLLDTGANRGVTGWFETNAEAKNGAVEMDATTQQVAETIILDANQTISKAKLLLYRSAAAPELLTVELFAVDTAHKPTGSALATGTIDCSAITEVTDGEEKTVTFGTPYAGVVDTEYALKGSRASVTAGSIFVCYSTSGNRGIYWNSADTGGTWTEDTAKDLVFSVYGTSSTNTLTQALLRMSIWLIPVAALMAIFYGVFKLMGRGRSA